MTTRKLLLVRHGLPDYRQGKAVDTPPGPGLSVVGHLQAEQAAEVVAEHRPQAIYSSPLARTWQTADWMTRLMPLPVRIEADLKEWHRTEQLYDVNMRTARWLRRWLATEETCAVVVSHASPLLSLIRTAMYLPQHHWWTDAEQTQLRLHSIDRFEISMASVFALTLNDETVEAECIFHPEPRIVAFRENRATKRFPRPTGVGENLHLRRPNVGRLIGWTTGAR